MEVFVNDTAYNNKSPITSGSKRRYKETEENQQTMCEIMEKIAREERSEGREEGRKEGRVEGVARINRLNSILIDLGRFDDMKRAAKDQAYQMQLILELLPEEA